MPSSGRSKDVDDEEDDENVKAKDSQFDCIFLFIKSVLWMRWTILLTLSLFNVESCHLVPWECYRVRINSFYYKKMLLFLPHPCFFLWFFFNNSFFLPPSFFKDNANVKTLQTRNHRKWIYLHPKKQNILTILSMNPTKHQKLSTSLPSNSNNGASISDMPCT